MQTSPGVGARVDALIALFYDGSDSAPVNRGLCRGLRRDVARNRMALYAQLRFAGQSEPTGLFPRSPAFFGPGIFPATSQPAGSVACETRKRRRQFCRTCRLNTNNHICSVACWIKNENILRSYTRSVFLRPAVIRALRDRCLERPIFPRSFYFRLRTSITIFPYSCFYIRNVFFSNTVQRVSPLYAV